MADDSVKQDIDGLHVAFKQLQSDLAVLTKTIGELTVQRATEGWADARLAGERVQEHLQKAAADAKAFGQSGISSLEQEISEKPLASVLIAFGVGLVIGKLLDRS